MSIILYFALTILVMCGISRSAAVLRDAFAAFSLDYRNDADGCGQRVLKEYQERMVKREC